MVNECTWYCNECDEGFCEHCEKGIEIEENFYCDNCAERKEANNQIKMDYNKKVFNENSLRKIVKDTSRAELKKELKDLRFEMKRLWDFLNKLRE